MRLRTLVSIVVMGMLPSLDAIASLKYDLSEALNDAGRQRMLGQKMLKSYAQIRLDVDVVQARLELLQAIDLYQQQHLNLLRFLEDEGTQQQLSRIDALWSRYRQQLVATDGQQAVVKASVIQELSSVSEELLLANEQLVKTLERNNDAKAGWLINISGRQRMLSQRLAKTYLLSSLAKQPQSSEELLKVQKEFSKTLHLLKTYNFGNLHITDSLAKIEAEWLWFQSVLEQDDGTRYNLIVAEASKQLLLQLEQLTFMYQLEVQKKVK
ncbi:MAG: type IV pili methyl-accepting chemotaxis transducer N-terminal domain-containing protein [Motiliproteus sp.]